MFFKYRSEGVHLKVAFIQLYKISGRTYGGIFWGEEDTT
jgi:hypothetical protein